LKCPKCGREVSGNNAVRGLDGRIHCAYCQTAVSNGVANGIRRCYEVKEGKVTIRANSIGELIERVRAHPRILPDRKEEIVSGLELEELAKKAGKHSPLSTRKSSPVRRDLTEWLLAITIVLLAVAAAVFLILVL